MLDPYCASARCTTENAYEDHSEQSVYSSTIVRQQLELEKSNTPNFWMHHLCARGAVLILICQLEIFETISMVEAW